MSIPDNIHHRAAAVGVQSRGPEVNHPVQVDRRKALPQEAQAVAAQPHHLDQNLGLGHHLFPDGEVLLAFLTAGESPGKTNSAGHFSLNICKKYIFLI